MADPELERIMRRKAAAMAEEARARGRGAAELDDAGFGEAVASGRPLLADFWAEWCGPCRAMRPVFDAAAREHPGVAFARVNVDAAPLSARRAGVSSVPTFIAFRGGREARRAVGAIGAGGVRRMAEEISGGG